VIGSEQVYTIDGEYADGLDLIVLINDGGGFITFREHVLELVTPIKEFPRVKVNKFKLAGAIVYFNDLTNNNVGVESKNTKYGIDLLQSIFDEVSK